MASKRGRLEDTMDDDDDDEEDEDDDDEAMRLDRVMEEETEEVTFEFDDPQDRHFESIRGLLRTSGALGLVRGSVRACDALADIAARDPASVGTVVSAGSDADDVVALAAIVRLQHYAVGANAGVDAARQTLAQAAPPTSVASLEAANASSEREHALVLRGKFVNVPPRVLAAAYRCLRKDMAQFDDAIVGFVVVVVAGGASAAASTKKPTAAAPLECDDFDDECFAAKASDVVPLPAKVPGGKKLYALHLSPQALRAAIDEINRLAEL
ncbi:hypothetical protein CTAYLR_007884 [Chrysophaeum taylorii]|uniref:Protein BCCIP homolog n=1 Tax=Chrysophaeum taylorii TaxID=2483200 RepID=A0AAD7XTB5_9STRA|nr:hypothetical protein CTAYLR_007884 [Chrysophaeum taylorii]